MEFIALYNVAWSPDGNSLACIAYKDGDGNGNHLYHIKSDGSSIIELALDDEGEKISPCWSPDSKWISYSSSGIRKVRLEGILWEVNTDEFLEKITN